MRNGSGRRLTKLNAFTCRPSDPAPGTVPKGRASNDVPRMRERRPGEDDGRTAASRRGGEAPGTGAERRPGAAPGGHARGLRFFY